MNWFICIIGPYGISIVSFVTPPRELRVCLDGPTEAWLRRPFASPSLRSGLRLTQGDRALPCLGYFVNLHYRPVGALFIAPWVSDDYFINIHYRALV
jgi:hypothetical protein